MDIAARPAGRLVLHDSNPGRVSLRPGGVGRNIAHDLRLLGVEVSLVTALGGDLFARAMAENCRELGISLSLARSLPEQSGGVYLYLSDGAGDLHAAVSDMTICQAVTPDWLAPRMGEIGRADAVVLDANLPEETLRYLAENCPAPLYADPVSSAKAPRLLKTLPRLRAVKPNAMEAEALTGERDPERAARALLSAGVGRALISLGPEGLLAAEGERVLRLLREPGPMVNTNGAGDAATAALVWADLLGLSLEQTARAAVLAGTLAIASQETNPPELRTLPEKIL